MSREGQQFVLKVALTAEENQRLHEEAEALRVLQSEFIVAIHDELEMAGRTVLVLQKAGEETLASLLRRDGVPGLELLGRYGEDLLNAIGSLERHGVAHRDIKPDNIGIRSLTKQRNQLILFDFSLTAAPLDNIRVGTPGYIDPFLPARKRVRWDPAADRYSAAVVLFEMSAGFSVLPAWGDGKSDPSLTDAELNLDAEKFDPAVRLGLVDFFRKSLHRDPEERYDNADEMKWAWQKIFRDAEDRQVKTATGAAVELGVALHEVELRTPIAALGLGSRATNGARTGQHSDRTRTAADAHHAAAHDAGRWKSDASGNHRVSLRDCDCGFPKWLKMQSSEKRNSKTMPNCHHWRHSGSECSEHEIRGRMRNGAFVWLCWLRLSAASPQQPPSGPVRQMWPRPSRLTPVAVNKVLSADRRRWAKEAALNLLRTELAEELLRQGGVMTVAEVTEFVLLRRPARDALDISQQQQFATVVARALVETEAGLAEPRFQLRRPGLRLSSPAPANWPCMRKNWAKSQISWPARIRCCRP
ncbi:MAG UNVERIFIED_CONTAM: hypothetical protein LVR18_50915 [Planctomycetaceae bacterium]